MSTFTDADSVARQIGIAFVLAFLVVVIARYILLLWLGYLHHIESRGRARFDDFVVEPPVSIIVPVYNEEAVILQAMRSLLSLRYSVVEIIIVDDGSTDRTVERATSMYLDDTAVRRFVSSRNRTEAKRSALNTGIAQARHPYVLCMDGDSRLDPETLRAAMRHFVDPRIGAVAGNVKVANRDNVWTRLQALEYLEGLNMARRAQGFLRVVNIIPGPIGVFRRDVLRSVGGYDTDTFAEDADLTLKILTAGWHVAYEERAIAYTEALHRFIDLVKPAISMICGILQALPQAKGLLALPRRPLIWGSLAAMLFEGEVLWPVMNVLGNLLFTLVALSAGVLHRA